MVPHAGPPNAPAPFLRAALQGREVAVMVATLGSYRLWSMSPDRCMAVSYPGLEDAPTVQWSKPSELFSMRPDTTFAE